jgi:hypothetical protein
MRRPPLPILAVLLTLSGLYGCGTIKRPEAAPPNIILVMADDQGWGDIGYNGHPVIRTPNLDAMASEGIRFDRFYAAAPVCSPTRGSVLTGRHPNRFECFTWGRTLRPQETTLAEVLRSAGYVTGHFGKWHLGSVRLGSPVNPGSSGFDEWFSAPNFFDSDPILSRNGIAVQTIGESSMVIVDAALEFIHKEDGEGSPYFAVVWFASPHLPHQATAVEREPYADQPEEMQNFYGEITGMDRAFGKLRSELKKLDSYPNTILWYCSDNGGLPAVGATGGRGNKGSIYEGGIRVPAILQWPAGFKEQEIIKAPANTSDIFPTLLDLAGIRMDATPLLDGISLRSMIEGETEVRSQPIGFWNYPAEGIRTPSDEWMSELLAAQVSGNMTGDSARLRLEAGEINTNYPLDSLPGHAVWLDWPWKLHRIESLTGVVQWELYNLEQDSMESSNIVEMEPGRVPAMKASLEEWQRSVVRSMNGEDYNLTVKNLKHEGTRR